MPDSEMVTLKEYFEKKICELERLQNVKFDEAKNALKIQAVEYERRLENLNNEASRLTKMQVTYLPRETYQTQYENLCIRTDNMEKFRVGLESKATTGQMLVGWALGASGIVIAITSMVFNIMRP
jgi:hypothetical protein